MTLTMLDNWCYRDIQGQSVMYIIILFSLDINCPSCRVSNVL